MNLFVRNIKVFFRKYKISETPDFIKSNRARILNKARRMRREKNDDIIQIKSTTSNCNSVVKYFSKQVSVRSSTNHQDRETSNGDHPVDKVGTIPRN